MPELWVSDDDERDDATARVHRLSGLTLRTVSYYNLDYLRWEVAPDFTGVRRIVEAAEWAEPTFMFPSGHTLDYGVELVGDDGRTLSLTWLPPGQKEGLAIYGDPLFPEVREGAAALWDVSQVDPWSDLLGSQVDDITIHWEPWEPSGAWWCTQVELAIRGVTIDVRLMQGLPDGTLEPSADNVVLQWR